LNFSEKSRVFSSLVKTSDPQISRHPDFSISRLFSFLRKQFNVSFTAFLQVTPEKPCFKVFRLSFLINFDYYKKIYNK